MKIIFINQKHTKTVSVNLSGWLKAFLSFCFLGIPSGAVIYAHNVHVNAERIAKESPSTWQIAVEKQQAEVEAAKQDAENQLSALTVKLSELQAKLLRIDALGERLTIMAGLQKGEFDFSATPALGGPEVSFSENKSSSLHHSDLGLTLSDLTTKLSDRQHQLETLEALLSNKKILNDVSVAGRPIKRGWMSSQYGMRNDPFTGKRAWHEGVDFAGKEGADIVSVASGIVTWSGERYGYGNLVEIHHSDGVKTRYAHCKEIYVKVGDVVKKGKVVATMGSTGRSTGPHVHFEVYKNGRTVDPASYVHRSNP